MRLTFTVVINVEHGENVPANEVPGKVHIAVEAALTHAMWLYLPSSKSLHPNNRIVASVEKINGG